MRSACAGHAERIIELSHPLAGRHRDREAHRLTSWHRPTDTPHAGQVWPDASGLPKNPGRPRRPGLPAHAKRPGHTLWGADRIRTYSKSSERNKSATESYICPQIPVCAQGVSGLRQQPQGTASKRSPEKLAATRRTGPQIMSVWLHRPPMAGPGGGEMFRTQAQRPVGLSLLPYARIEDKSRACLVWATNRPEPREMHAPSTH